MNGEAATTGREALMAWKVDRGSFEGVSLNGLAVVAAVAGDVNLSIREIGGETARTRSAIFVDERATAAQRAALVSMAKRLSNGTIETIVETTPTSIQFVDDGQAFRIAAKSVRLTVDKEMKHDPTCGGRQWFHPCPRMRERRWAPPLRTPSTGRRSARSGATRTSGRPSSGRSRPKPGARLPRAF